MVQWHEFAAAKVKAKAIGLGTTVYPVLAVLHFSIYTV